jgi:hypothetical protein
MKTFLLRKVFFCTVQWRKLTDQRKIIGDRDNNR